MHDRTTRFMNLYIPSNNINNIYDLTGTKKKSIGLSLRANCSRQNKKEYKGTGRKQ